VPLNALVARIDATRIAAETPPGLAGAIRLWLVAWLQQTKREAGDSGEAKHLEQAAPEAEQQQG
jgi:uncharacterized protein YfaQ (DUF2300 family)